MINHEYSKKTGLQQGSNQSAIQWYLLNGSIESLDCEFDNEEWGIEVETGRVIDPDGCPVSEGGHIEIAVNRMVKLAE